MASLVCIAVLFASIALSQGLYQEPKYHSHHEEVHHPKYEFHYEVNDHHTGDIKSQKESRDGDHVEGYYSLIGSDGSKRTVQYHDQGHGFNALVHREHNVHHAPAVKHIAPLQLHAAPVSHYKALPIVHSAPAHYSNPHHLSSYVQQYNTFSDKHHGYQNSHVAPAHSYSSSHYSAPVATHQYSSHTTPKFIALTNKHSQHSDGQYKVSFSSPHYSYELHH